MARGRRQLDKSKTTELQVRKGHTNNSHEIKCVTHFDSLYNSMCVDELLILFVSSVKSLLVVLCPAPVLQFFKSALLLNHSFKDCLPQVNPGHMNIFMEKNP